jgi:hypothetical protein
MALIAGWWWREVVPHAANQVVYGILLLLSLLNVVEAMIDLLAPLCLLLLPLVLLVECGHHFCITSFQVCEAVVEVGGVNMDA